VQFPLNRPSEIARRGADQTHSADGPREPLGAVAIGAALTAASEYDRFEKVNPRQARTMETSAIDIPQVVTDKWQEITNLLAELVQVPAALVMRIEPPEISVFVASKSQGNPYQPRERACLNTGLYCETVMRTRQFLLVPDARDDDEWRSNPDIKLGMISYLGLPISWPNGDIFGTICVLDHKRNAYREVHHRLLLLLRDAVEADLRSVFLYETRLVDEKRVKERLEAQVTERTAELAKINDALSLEVAEHKRAAAALRESEQRFRDYTETASDWLWETGPDHRFIRLSEQLATIGVDPALRIGAARWDFATDLEEEPEKWRRHVATLEAHEPFHNFRYGTTRGDGSVLHIAISGKPVFDPEGRFLGYRGTTTDLTAAVRAEHAEKALQQAQAELARVARLTTMGELAASIAHEINQPLTGVLANGNAGLQWLNRDKPDLDEARNALSCIVSDGTRAGEVIRGLRALAKKSGPELVQLDINDAVREVQALTRSELQRHGVTLHTDLSADDRPVFGDRVQLQQVLLNLIMNGIEAMRAVTERPKTLAITSEPVEPSGVLVAVEDTGTGLDPATADRIFDPFFTTKSDGLGMGLSICRSIIDAHGGRLWVSPGVLYGTVFRFTVPGVLSS
jgi:PAS domain S-box-containing protein